MKMNDSSSGSGDNCSGSSGKEQETLHPKNFHIPEKWEQEIIKSYNKRLIEFSKQFQPIKSMDELFENDNKLFSLTKDIHYFRRKYQLFKEIDERMYVFLMSFLEYYAVYSNLFITEFMSGMMSKKERQDLKLWFHDTCKKFLKLELLNLEQVKHKYTTVFIHVYYPDFSPMNKVYEVIEEVRNRKYGYALDEIKPTVVNTKPIIKETNTCLKDKCNKPVLLGILFCKYHSNKEKKRIQEKSKKAKSSTST